MLYLVVFTLSLVSAIIIQLRTEEKYAAQFSVAPHYEFANDVGIKLSLFCKDLERLDQLSFKKRYGISFDNSIVLKALSESTKRTPNHSFKHIYNRVYLEFSSFKIRDLEILDSFLIAHIDNFVTDTNFSYRGMEILKMKLNDFVKGDTTIISNFSETVNYYQAILEKDNIVASDSLINRIMISELKGEIKNAHTNNYIYKFQDTYRKVDLSKRKIQTFLTITFLPIILLFSLMAVNLE